MGEQQNRQELMDELRRRADARGEAEDIPDFEEVFHDTGSPLLDEPFSYLELTDSIESAEHFAVLGIGIGEGTGIKHLIKRIIWRIIHFPFIPPLQQQNAFNGSMTHAMQEVFRYISAQRAKQSPAEAAKTSDGVTEETLIAFMERQETLTEQLQSRIVSLELELEKLRKEHES